LPTATPIGRITESLMAPSGRLNDPARACGVSVVSTDIAVSINTSTPFDDDSDADNVPNNGWAGDVNNASAIDTEFAVWVICTSATSVR
jgi:hypothetical protein